MTHSKLLTPSINKCPSLLGLEFLSRERVCGFLEIKREHFRKIETQSLKIAIKL